jgi:hypothetical protein
LSFKAIVCPASSGEVGVFASVPNWGRLPRRIRRRVDASDKVSEWGRVGVGEGYAIVHQVPPGLPNQVTPMTPHLRQRRCRRVDA